MSVMQQSSVGVSYTYVPNLAKGMCMRQQHAQANSVGNVILGTRMSLMVESQSHAHEED